MKHILSITVCCLVAVHLCMAEVVLENDLVSIAFDADSFSVQHVVEKASGYDFMSSRSLQWWSASFVAQGGSAFSIGSDSVSARRVHALSRHNATQKLLLSFVDIAHDSFSFNVSVVAALDDKTALVRFESLSVTSTNTAQVALTSVSMSLATLKKEANALALTPNGYGETLPASQSWSGAYPSSGCTMQFMALLNGNAARPSLYFGVHDAESTAKSLSLAGSSSSVTFAVSRAVEQAGLVASLPFVNAFPLMSIGVVADVAADWYDLTMLYRAFIFDSSRPVPWVASGPVYERADFPPWIFEQKVWVNSHWQGHDVFNRSQGDPVVVYDHVSAIKKRFNTSLALHWYEWDLIAFDTHYPEYFPPKPGFQEAVSALQALGVRVFPYINGRIYDINTAMYKRDNATRFVCKYPKKANLGDTGLTNYQESYGSGATFNVMCPTTAYWQDIMSNTVERLTHEYNLDGVYIDQIGAAAPKLCYDASHGHAVGGGSWWTDGYRALLQQTRTHAGDQAGLVTESNAEPYMGSLNSYLTLVAYGKDFAQSNTSAFFTPAFPAIYGGYFLSFGAEFYQTDLSPNADVFAAKIAKMFVSGSQLGWFSLGGTTDVPMMGLFDQLMDPKHDPEIAYLRLLADFKRHADRPFLVGGRLMRDLPASSSSSSTPTTTTVSTFRVATQHQGSVYTAVPTTLSYPSIMSAAWLSSDASQLAVFYTAVTTQSSTIDVTLDTTRYGFPPSLASATVSVVLVDRTGASTPVGSFTANSVHLSKPIAGREVVMFVVTIANH